MHTSTECIITRAVKQLVYLIALSVQLIFLNCSFNAYVVCYIVQFVFYLQLDVVGPLQLNASLLLVLTTHYSE